MCTSTGLCASPPPKKNPIIRSFFIDYIHTQAEKPCSREKKKTKHAPNLEILTAKANCSQDAGGGCTEKVMLMPKILEAIIQGGTAWADMQSMLESRTKQLFRMARGKKGGREGRGFVHQVWS